jgi:hypothetical protein
MEFGKNITATRDKKHLPMTLVVKWPSEYDSIEVERKNE